MNNITIKMFYITLLAITFLSFTTYGQNLEASFSLGYGVGILKSDFGFNRTRTNNTDVRDYVSYSLGKGTRINAGATYQLKENIKAGLDIGYQIGGKTKSVETDLRTAPTLVKTTTIKSNTLSFVPNITLSLSNDGFAPYLKTGLFLGFPKIKLHERDEAISTSSRDTKYSKSTAFGIYNAVGAHMEMFGLKFFGELFANLASYNTKYSEITSVIVNGTEEISNFNVKSLQTVYLKNYDRGKNIPNTQPDEELRIKMPFSAIGFKIGVKYGF